MVTKFDLDDWAERLGEAIAQGIAERCYKYDDYPDAVRREYDALSQQEKFILWSFGADYVENEEADLEEHVIQVMIETCQTLRFDEGM